MKYNFESQFSNWEQFSPQERAKKDKEVFIATFMLKEAPCSVSTEESDDLCMELHEEPDFLLYSKKDCAHKIGLELTKCYMNNTKNSSKVHSDLELICQRTIEKIQRANGVKCNYARVTFAREIMEGEKYDKKKLRRELKSFILNGNKQGEYVRNVVVGYSDAYVATDIKIMVFSEMMYSVIPVNSIIIKSWNGDRMIDLDPVRVCIEKKEKKLIEYKQKCAGSVKQWWLCIEVPEDAHINPSSYALPENFDSGYDKIFLVTTAIYGYGVQLIYES